MTSQILLLTLPATRNDILNDYTFSSLPVYLNTKLPTFIFTLGNPSNRYHGQNNDLAESEDENLTRIRVNDRMDEKTLHHS